MKEYMNSVGFVVFDCTKTNSLSFNEVNCHFGKTKEDMEIAKNSYSNYIEYIQLQDDFMKKIPNYYSD